VLHVPRTLLSALRRNAGACFGVKTIRRAFAESEYAPSEAHLALVGKSALLQEP